jgi:membrane associated rhomboid family serine protease
MAHDHKDKKEEINFKALYYLTGLVCGLFTGWVIDKDLIWILVGGILGLLTAALFQQVFVRGREQR